MKTTKIYHKDFFVFYWQIYRKDLPKKNVVLCLSLLACGRKAIIPLLRFPFEKCFMNVDSTLSMSLVT